MKRAVRYKSYTEMHAQENIKIEDLLVIRCLKGLTVTFNSKTMRRMTDDF
jgi:hypothetical protein